MKTLITILIILLVLLQFKLWFGDGSVREVWRLETAIDSQQKKNALLQERNAALEAEVKDLKKGLEAIEERARSELGMIKKDETFYQIIDVDGAKQHLSNE
ncbi:MAG: cell division protein FtsB [Gammaproteobacteria bacterium]|nr:cell division protein FtsB [Gammaproteobacteria bacterium]